jgi:hypothetical protein
MVDKRLSKEEAARQMAAADNRVKGISSIANNTVKRSKTQYEKQYGTPAAHKQTVTATDKALSSLSKATQALASGVKTITVETAKGVKNITASGAKAMNEYAKAITEDIHINRKNFMVTTIGKFTPLVGYAVAKMMETTVFRNMIDKMKAGLGRALDSVTSRFKRLASMGWEKGKEFWSSAMDRISGKTGAVKSRMANARKAKKEKASYTKEQAIKEALADARVQSAARKASKTKGIEDQVPHMASGGYVQKEGLAKVHAAEVVQPVDKIVETIVDTVNKRLDAKEAKKKEGLFEGTMFEKAKGQDFFGFDKVGKSIKSGMDIMFRKNLALEQRVMKRDKKNQQGLIGSFMTAYSQEAKQEELPLMERQVRAILELKSTISGDQKIRQAAWEKMLYEHPVFHAITLGMKGIAAGFTSPMKFLFKRRGVYASQLSTKGTVFERMVDAGAQTFQGLMTKMDDLISNTYIIANASHATALKAGATKQKIDPVKAPGQTGYTIAGFLYKMIVKKPAAAIGWAAKKLGSKSKFLKNESTVEGTLGDSWDETKKLWRDRGKRIKTKYRQAMYETPKMKANRTRKELREKKELKDKKAAAKALKKGRFGRDQQNWSDRKSMVENLKSGMSMKEAAKAYRVMKNTRLGRPEQYDDFTASGREEYKQKNIAENREKNRKKGLAEYRKKQASFGGKDRTGKKTTAGTLEEIKDINKKNLQTNVKSTGIAKSGAKAMSKMGGWLWKIGGIVMSFISSGVAGLTALLGPILGGAIAVALAGAAGAAIGTALNKYVVSPISKKMFAKQDKKNDKAGAATQKTTMDGFDAIKKFKAGDMSKEDAYKKLNVSKLQMGVSSQMGSATENYIGWNARARNNWQLIEAGSAEYLNENIGEYAPYGWDQVNALRTKWSKTFKQGKAARNWHQMGRKREMIFLKHLKKKGKVKTEEQISSQGAKYFGGQIVAPKTKLKEMGNKPNSYKPGSVPSRYNQAQVDAAGEADKDKGYINFQATVSDYLPLINQFAGNTTTGFLLAQYIQKKSGENPKALLNAANAIKKLTNEQAVKYGIDDETKKAAGIISSKYSAFKTEYDKGEQYIRDKYDIASGKVKAGWGTFKKNKKQFGTVAAMDMASHAAAVGTEKLARSSYTSAKTAVDRLLASGTAKDLVASYEGGIEALKTKPLGEIKDLIKEKTIEKAKEAKKIAEKKAKGINDKYGVTDKASLAWSKAKQKAGDLKINFLPMIMTMGDNIITSLMKLGQFFIDAYGDPKQFYIDTKEKVWDSLYDINEYSRGSYKKMHEMYLLQKWNAQFQYDQITKGSTMQYEAPPGEVVGSMSGAISGGFKFPGPKGKASTFYVTGHSGEQMIVTPTEAEYQERFERDGMGSKKVAQMGARKDLLTAALQSGMMDSLKGVKDSVDSSTKATIANLQQTFNNSTNMSTTSNNSGGGSARPPREIDPHTLAILQGRLT